MLVADEYAEALVAGADPDPVLVQRFAEAVVRAQGLGTYVSAVLLTPETFAATAALRPGDHGTSAVDRDPHGHAGDPPLSPTSAAGSPGRERRFVRRVARKPFAT
jgi:hypothetical protein